MHGTEGDVDCAQVATVTTVEHVYCIHVYCQDKPKFGGLAGRKRSSAVSREVAQNCTYLKKEN